jgi:hypothetical protein
MVGLPLHHPKKFQGSFNALNELRSLAEHGFDSMPANVLALDAAEAFKTTNNLLVIQSQVVQGAAIADQHLGTIFALNDIAVLVLLGAPFAFFKVLALCVRLDQPIRPDGYAVVFFGKDAPRINHVVIVDFIEGSDLNDAVRWGHKYSMSAGRRSRHMYEYPVIIHPVELIVAIQSQTSTLSSE